MQRVSFFIDGFNVYHKINEYQEKTGIYYKWLDYKSFLNSFLQSDQLLQDIYFFTAVSKSRGQLSIDRHNKYITALQNTGVKVIIGKFITTPITCKVKNCNYSGSKEFMKDEEKKSDVNLAINMVLDSSKDVYDKCFLFSSDSDFVPALKMVKEMGKNVGLLVPPQDKVVKVTAIDELKGICFGKGNSVIETKFDELGKYLLPSVIIDPKTNIAVKMPIGYQSK